MKKDTKLWSLKDLQNNFRRINFPEYQREPNVWSLDAKQRLIDSISRQFDIASIYLYRTDDGLMDCIDGRQRINTIMSFLGENPKDSEHSSFPFKVLNEIFPDDEDYQLNSLEGLPFPEIKERAESGDEDASSFLEVLASYRITVVLLSGSRKAEEFNLQFTRLNLGTIINSGEKLNAMVGELRNVCFDRVGKHPFFEKTRIPTRRFANEQVAAQLMAQVLSKQKTGEYARTRHFDLQKVFKEHGTLTPEQHDLVDKTYSTLDLLDSAFDVVNGLRNRAITVSVVLLAMEREVADGEAALELAKFIDGFVCRLQWQMKLGVDLDDEYRHLLDFQRHLTQASVEKSAVEARSRMLNEEFDHWIATGSYTGDAEYTASHGEDPGETCRQ